MDAYLILAIFLMVAYWVSFCIFKIVGIDVPEGFNWAGWGISGVALFAGIKKLVQHIDEQTLKPGDHIIYDMQKSNLRPGPRAEEIKPFEHGDGYRYIVRKPWTVVDVTDDGDIEAVTPGGKLKTVPADDPKLHKAGLIESLMLQYCQKICFLEYQFRRNRLSQ